MLGYRENPTKLALFRLACLCTVGLLGLACYWFPALRVRLTMNRCELAKSQYVLFREPGALKPVTLAFIFFFLK